MKHIAPSNIDDFPTVTVNGHTFAVNRLGFPVEVCGRCGGTGHFSYNQMDGSTCYGCSGSGICYAAGTAAKVHGEYRAALQAQRETTVGRVSVGDTIAFGRSMDTLATPRRWEYTWKTVAALNVTPRICGTSRIGTAEPTYQYDWAVTYTDGTHQIVGGHTCCYRQGAIDAAPYAARAQAAMVAKLARRPRATAS